MSIPINWIPSASLGEGCDIRLVDDQGNELPQGEAGESSRAL